MIIRKSARDFIFVLILAATVEALAPFIYAIF